MKTKQFFEVIKFGQERTLGAVFCSDTWNFISFFRWRKIKFPIHGSLLLQTPIQRAILQVVGFFKFSLRTFQS
jgi:hypothetical protein